MVIIKFAKKDLLMNNVDLCNIIRLINPIKIIMHFKLLKLIK